MEGISRFTERFATKRAIARRAFCPMPCRSNGSLRFYRSIASAHPRTFGTNSHPSCPLGSLITMSQLLAQPANRRYKIGNAFRQLHLQTPSRPRAMGGIPASRPLMRTERRWIALLVGPGNTYYRWAKHEPSPIEVKLAEGTVLCMRYSVPGDMRAGHAGFAGHGIQVGCWTSF